MSPWVNRRTRTVSLVLVVVATTVLLAGCRRLWWFRQVSTLVAVPCTSVPPLSHEGDSVSVDVKNSLLAKGICNYQIPEFHDEQRLRVGRVHYGALVTSFATPLDTLRETAVFDTTWVNVAVVSVVEAATWPVPHEYKHLHVLVGTNCLFIKHFATPPQWRADMEPGSGAAACPHPPSTTKGNLPAYADPPVADWRDLPPVTRFVEDINDNTAIGVPCGMSWCYAGLAAGAAIPPPFFASALTAASSRSSIKGWYDEQHLAVQDGNETPPIRSQLLGAAIPVDTLATMSFVYGTWSHVAVVLFDGQTSGKYGAGSLAYGFVGNKAVNKVWLRRTVGTNGKDVWNAYVGDTRPTGADNTYTRLQVVQTDHRNTPFTVPGTARWRFVDSDEKLWVACLNGCCMIVPHDA